MFTHFFNHIQFLSLLKINVFIILGLFSASTLCLPNENKDIKYIESIEIDNQNNRLNSTEKALPWKLWKKNNKVSVEYRELPNKALIEIKAQVIVISSLSGALLFLQDTTNITHWLENVTHSEIIDTISAHENISQTAFDSFWPIKRREVIVRSRYWQNKDLSVEVTIEDKSKEYRHLLTKGAIPISMIFAHWKISPYFSANMSQGLNNTLIIEHVVIADPNGSLPSWLTNRMALKSMWKSLNNISEQLPKSPYQQQSLKNVIEPLAQLEP